jgi:GT2 family glycosyltransferase
MAEKNKWSVVIPTNSPKRLGRAVRSIVKAHGTPDIIVIDDCEIPIRDSLVRTVPGIKPFIFSRNVNFGIVAAGTDDVIVMGDDVEVLTTGAFDILRDVAMANPNAAVISAGINGPVANQDQRIRPLPSKRRTFNALAFICVYMPRAWIEKVGLFDERFTGYGFEDTDWCQRAINAGGSLFIDDHARVNHNDVGMESAYRSKPDIIEKAEKSKKIFLEKWAKGVSDESEIR